MPTEAAIDARCTGLLELACWRRVCGISDALSPGSKPGLLARSQAGRQCSSRKSAIGWIPVLRQNRPGDGNAP